ncbi:oxidoreductase [Arthrobacter sp. MYb227]|uniref:NAD(P)/FAD-dependent oxidoreductase n=1 Tax=Arthrobacter sp. MYb227 TaxID=1848601 RepID=UPI000CFBC399|nr:FAD-dependent oxidoreductase [Arthrobacter sp. MYb227]PQZ95109.1 oxidoreductase [Arthrobacter sp. MYb227]
MANVDAQSPKQHSNVGTLVIGGGLAGAQCVHALREGGYAKTITIVGDENEIPYERPPLSKQFLQGSQTVEEFQPFQATWYSSAQVEMRLGTTASSIDVVARRVFCSDDTSIGYETLVLATGSRSRMGGRGSNIEGWDLPGVYTLRSLEDSRRLKGAFATGKRLVIIGAGWIGMEVAASARAAGMEITVLTPDQLPLAVPMGVEFGSHVARLQMDHGVHFIFGTAAEKIVNDPTEGLAVMTPTGLVAADSVLLAIGAVPNTELALEAGLQMGHGIIVDTHLRTSDPHILAIGDIAEAFNTALGRALRVEHWDNAMRQGKLAASTILGREETYDWLPYFFTDQFDLGMEYVGDRQDDDDVVVRGEMSSGEFMIFWLRSGVISAAMNVNIWDVNDLLRGVIGKEIPVERLVDVSVKLADL